MAFKFIKQHDGMQCGIAALAMICRHFGADYSIQQLSEICHTTNEGVSLLGILDATKSIGLNAMAGRFTIEQLKTLPLPCILHWNQNHFVVLYKISKNGKKYHIADPGKGLIVCSLSEMEEHWISLKLNEEGKGVAMLFETTPDFKKQESDVSKRKSFHFLMTYIKQYAKYFIQIFLGLVFGCVLQLIMPFLTQSIVDVGIKNNNINFIWLVLLGQFMIVLGRTATDFLRRWLLMHISMRINISLVSDFFIKLLKLPMSFFDTKLMGDLMQRMGDHKRVEQFLTNQTLNVVFSTINFFVLGGVLFVYNDLIFGVFVFGTTLYAAWIISFFRRRKVLDYELFEQQAINQNKTYQFITTMQEIKLQDCEKRRRWEWEDVQADLFKIQMKTLKLQQTQEAGSILINEMKNILTTVLAATAVIEGQLTLGMMLAVQYIIGQLNSPIEQLMGFIYSSQDVQISLERINEIHMVKDEIQGGDLSTSYDGLSKSITINSIDFKYDPHSLSKTIDDISFEIEEGKVCAIVGASGSGKTTLIKLLLGYYPVTGGNISIAGKSIGMYNLKWWRRQCGVVMQDGVIFSESIARNIAVGDGDIDMERLKKAAQIANIHDFITNLPLNYNTQIGRDGVGLSQGQKQRILIARAVYKNPDYLFLDEATNALDAENEKTIVENLTKFYKGRTVVIVAHRLSTVKNADQIIVIGNGKILEKGNHVELIEKKGAYYNLIKNQLELGN